MKALPDEPVITVRPAVSRDLDVLVEIDAICFPPEIAYPRREIAFLLRSPATQTVVAMRNGTPIGFAALRHFHRGEQLCGDLVTIDVLPQFRRAKIGWQLYTDLETRLLRNGGGKIELHVSVENTGALNFYGKLGYSMIERVQNYYLNAIDAWHMEKMFR